MLLMNTGSPSLPLPSCSRDIVFEPSAFHGLRGYTMLPFDDPQRNHWEASTDQRKIRFIIVHYTQCELKEALERFTSGSPKGRVSAHFVITEQEDDHPGGTCLQCVHENDIAWHAGRSEWDDEHNLNATSIGIELINPGTSGREYDLTSVEQERIDRAEKKSPFFDSRGQIWFPFETPQIQTLIRLIQGLQERYCILPHHILSHSDIAPGRKEDPGPLFPWDILAQHDIGAWLFPEERNKEYIIKHFTPETSLPAAPDPAFFLHHMARYGYTVNTELDLDAPLNRMAFEAFKAHFSSNQDLNTWTEPHLTMNDMLWIWGLNAKHKITP